MPDDIYLSEFSAGVCGLYCGICPAYPADCKGCLSEQVHPLCNPCRHGFRRCAQEHQVTRCFECTEYPCQRLTIFRNDGMEHHLVAFDNIDRQRQIGLSAWLEEQASEHTCPACGAIVHWERTTCQECGREL